MSAEISYCASKFQSPVTYSAESIREELTEEITAAVNHSPGNTVKARWRAAARALQIPVSRVKCYWYGDIHRVEAHEYLNLKERLRTFKMRHIARLEAELAILRAEANIEARELGIRNLDSILPPETD